MLWLLLCCYFVDVCCGCGCCCCVVFVFVDICCGSYFVDVCCCCVLFLLTYVVDVAVVVSYVVVV